MNTTTYQFCDNPAPQHNWSLCNCTELESPNSCNGTYAEVFESCDHNPCPIDGSWSEVKGQCECGQMNTTTFKFCDSPRPQYNGNPCNCTELDSPNVCNGTYAEVLESCGHNPCPIDGGWSEVKGQCECGQMNTTTFRFCDSPRPQYNGNPCNCTELDSPNVCNETYAEVYESCGDNPCSKLLFTC